VPWGVVCSSQSRSAGREGCRCAAAQREQAQQAGSGRWCSLQLQCGVCCWAHLSVSACIQQQLDKRHVAALAGPVQRAAPHAAIVESVDVSASRQQGGRQLSVAAPGRHVQQGGLVECAGVDAGVTTLQSEGRRWCSVSAPASDTRPGRTSQAVVSVWSPAPAAYGIVGSYSALCAQQEAWDLPAQRAPALLWCALPQRRPPGRCSRWCFPHRRQGRPGGPRRAPASLRQLVWGGRPAKLAVSLLHGPGHAGDGGHPPGGMPSGWRTAHRSSCNAE
jgi:hypothetical protein